MKRASITIVLTATTTAVFLHSQAQLLLRSCTAKQTYCRKSPFFPLSIFIAYIYSYSASNLQNVAMSFLGVNDLSALNPSSNSPKFKQLEIFLNNVQILIPLSSGKTKTIRGLIERGGKFVFSKNDDQESTVGVSFIYLHLVLSFF